MNKLKFSTCIIALFFLMVLGCSSDKRESGGAQSQEAQSVGQVEAVETEDDLELCGGIAGIECIEGQVCDLPEGQCAVADAQGTCMVQPQICTKDYRPVCGCDGRTYSNDCTRLSAGVQKNHGGECRTGDQY